MRRLLFGLLVVFAIVCLGEWLTYCLLKYEYNHMCFNCGLITMIMAYIVLERIFHIKDRSKDGVAHANITVTVKDVNNADEVADSISTGMKIFDRFVKLGKSYIHPEEDEPDPEVEPVEDVTE